MLYVDPNDPRLTRLGEVVHDPWPVPSVGTAAVCKRVMRAVERGPAILDHYDVVAHASVQPGDQITFNIPPDLRSLAPGEEREGRYTLCVNGAARWEAPRAGDLIVLFVAN